VADVIVVDASCLFEVVVDTPRSESIRERLGAEPDQAEPHIVDIEVFSLIRRDHLAGTIDEMLHNAVWPVLAARSAQPIVAG
jgi:predicted nucleic acid-binding protein